MITFFTYPGPNARKVSIMLEEVQARYETKIVDITKGEQFHPDFLKVNPNNKLPAILDNSSRPGAAIPVFEVGAILLYLAEKFGMYLSTKPKERAETITWLVWGLTGLGSTLPQLHHFGDRKDETAPEVIDRFASEAARLYKVLEKRLGEHKSIAGEYSIADMPTYASTVGMLATVKQWKPEIQNTPNVDRWVAEVGKRAGVSRGMAV